MKKKIFALVLCVAMLAIAIVGGTLAYFTDTKAQTNTFTAGEVKITLDEAKVTKNDDGNLVKDGENRTSDAQSYKLFPAMTVAKDPTITVQSNSEAAYLGAIITVKGDLYGLIGVTGEDDIDITKLVSGGIVAAMRSEKTTWNGLEVYENDNFAIYSVPGANNTKASAADTWTLYVFIKAVQEKNNKVVLFDTLTIPADYDHDQMSKLNGASISVKAFATQANGFDNCFTAMTKAFPTEFSFATNP